LASVAMHWNAPSGHVRVGLPFPKETHAMNRISSLFFRFSVISLGIGLGALQVQAQGFNGPAAAAARKKQLAIEASTPKLKITEEVLPLRVPGHTIGETEGVSMNSKGHLFVYSRTGKGGSARGGTAAELFEFDQNLKFVKLWGPDNYAASFAHNVRVDRHDNVWMVDEGSNMIVEFDPTGMVRMTLGRKPEAIDYLERYLERGEKVTDLHPVGTMGTFNRETDITWDPEDNIYVSDGYGNSRIVKISKDGVWLKAVGTYGSGKDQFNTAHGIATDGQGNIYVADRGNWRIQVYDYNLNYKKTITGVGMPWTVQVTPHYIYSGDGNGKIYQLDHNGKLLGWAQTGLGYGQTNCIIHELYARSDHALYRGSCSEWNVEKITIQ
jgi:NHL repeat